MQERLPKLASVSKCKLLLIFTTVVPTLFHGLRYFANNFLAFMANMAPKIIFYINPISRDDHFSTIGPRLANEIPPIGQNDDSSYTNFITCNNNTFHFCPTSSNIVFSHLIIIIIMAFRTVYPQSGSSPARC